MKTDGLRRVARVSTIILLAGALAAYAARAAADNPALWKYRAQGEFAEVLSHIRHGLQAAQFQITQEENLSRGLENNKHLFPEGKWNAIGFDNITALHFCSVVFNQEAFNVDLDWSVLCPFKLVAYTTKKAPKDVTIVLIRPTYILDKDTNPKAKDVAQRIERRITGAITEGLSH